MRRVPTLLPTSYATRPRTSVVLALVLVAVVTLVVGFADTLEALWFPLFGNTASVSPVDQINLQLAWPMVGRGVAWVPSWFAIAAVTALTFALLSHLGCRRLTAASASLALSFSASFWGWTAVGSPAMSTMMFLIGAIGGLLLWRDTGHRLPLVAAALSYGLAVVGHPVVLGLFPAVLWVVGSRAVSLAIMTTAGVVGTLGFWWTVGGQTSPTDWFVSDAVASIGRRLGATSAMFMGDFGIMGAALLVAGCVRLTLQFGRMGFLVGAAVGMGAWAMIWEPPDWQTALLLAFVPLWLLVGLGMEWVSAQAETRTARLGAAMLVVLLPAMSVVAHFEAGAQARGGSVLADRLLDRLELPSGAAILAEGGLLERRLVARAARDPETTIARMPQAPAEIVRALEASTPIVGFAGARENLRALGFHFQDVGPGVLMTIDEFVETVPKGWIVAVAAGAGFLRSLQPNQGPTFGALGGTEDLFGTSRDHYGLIGVRGRASVLLESHKHNDFDIGVKAAESLTPYDRSPAAIRVSGRAGAVAVAYKGKTVAESHYGLALAVISPSGEFQAAYQSELGQDDRLWIRPPTLNPGLVTGREPCTDVPARQWTDVSHVAGRVGLGGLLEPGQNLTLYVAADHPLTPRVVQLGQPTRQNLAVVSFDATSVERRAVLRDLLRAERLGSFEPELLPHPYVYRIESGTSASNPRQLALNLGGFATRAFGWLEGGPAVPVVLCSAMQVAIKPNVDLDRDDLFVYGWDSVERANGTLFRWTRTPRAELLLPMAGPELLTVAIAATPMAGPGTTIELRVNETQFPPVVMTGSEGEYRWEVPADSWRAGMNRVWLGVSELARPSDRYGTGDTRQLGLAVRQIRLIPAAPRPTGVQ